MPMTVRSASDEETESPIGICPDPYCRYCRGQDGEVREECWEDSPVERHPAWVYRQPWRQHQ